MSGAFRKEWTCPVCNYHGLGFYLEWGWGQITTIVLTAGLGSLFMARWLVCPKCKARIAQAPPE